MVSDVELGSFLSGGIDSSLIVRAMAESRAPTTFSIGVDASGWDERPYAREVASRYGDTHYEGVFEPLDLETLHEMVGFLDEPLGDSSFVPVYQLSKLAKSQVTVALSGDGGDELFWGYTRYQSERTVPFLRHIPGAIGRLAAGCVRFPGVLGRRSRWVQHVLDTSRLTFSDRYIRRESLPCPLATPLCHPRLHDPCSEAELLAPVLGPASYGEFEDALTLLSRVDLEFYLPNCMLAKVDRMSMASSLEVRVPFLDERMVRFASTLPGHMKLRGLKSKHILRQIAKETLPRSVWKRRKQGFGLPVDSWFRSDLADFAEQNLLSERALEREIVAEGATRSLLRLHTSGEANYGHTIFALLTLEMWLQIHIDPGA